MALRRLFTLVRSPTAWFSVLALCLVALLLWGKKESLFSQEEAETDIQPSLSFPRSPIFLGEAISGEDFVARVKVHNRGDVPRRIDRIVPSCGCASFESGSLDILPGNTALIELKIRIPPDPQHTRRRFTVGVYSDDPVQGVSTLELILQIAKPPIDAEPRDLDFGEIIAGRKYSQVVRLHGVKHGDLTSVRSEQGLFHVSKALGPNVGIVVSPNQDLPFGFFSDRLILTNAKGQDTRLAVHGIVSSRSHFYPRSLDLKEAEPAKQAFVIRFLDNVPKTLDVRPPSYLACDVRKLGTAFLLTVKYCGQTGARLPARDKIRITAVPDREVIDIPITFEKGAVK